MRWLEKRRCRVSLNDAPRYFPDRPSQQSTQLGGGERGGQGSAFPALQEAGLMEASPGFGSSPVTDKPAAVGNQEQPVFHGEALARDPWLERYGGWIVSGFTAAFALFLLAMVAAGNVPGQSFPLKTISDVLQFVGEGIGLFFCVRITYRLWKVSVQLRRNLAPQEMQSRTRMDLIVARTEVQAATRAWVAWTLLSLGVALYASGQAMWTSYDVRMPSSQVPFPGIYDIGFVGSYPFFLAGMLLLTRRNRAAIGRARLLLDALAVIGAALALSWFFVLGPSIAGLSNSPGSGAAFLSVYFPASDLFLVAVGTFMMFSPLSTREQQPVFVRLCLGLFFLAITDSLLGYFSLSPSGFNSGTLQDQLWPLSMLLIGLAAIQYPRSVASEQEKAARLTNPLLTSSLSLANSRVAQFGTTAQTIAPFLLALFTCAILLTVVAPRGGATLIQADLIALALILIVVVRQALTMMENNRLTMQLRRELVISRRELQVMKREADESAHAAQEKRILEESIAALQDTYSRGARGDFNVRAPVTAGPLMPIAISFNLILDRLSTLTQRASEYDQILREYWLLQEAMNRLIHGMPAWPLNQPLPRSTADMGSLFLGLSQLQRVQENQWKRLATALESMSTVTRRLREALTEVWRANQLTVSGRSASTAERTAIERSIRAADLLDQQLTTLLTQIRNAAARLEQLVGEEGRA